VANGAGMRLDQLESLREAMLGAQADPTLYRCHFDGNSLNDLGKTKLDLLLANGAPAKIYVSSSRDSADACRASVNSYLAAAKVADGTVKNELSLLRRIINLARDRGLQTSTVSFRGAIPEANTRARILTDTESERLFAILPTWFRRVVAGCASDRLVRGRSIALDRRHD